MARIGSLMVNLLLEDASFVNGLKRATKQHEASMKSMERAANLATAGMKTLGAIAGSVFSARAIKGALDYAGSIGEISSALGVSTKELQVYRYAATQANLSNEAIEKGLAKATLEVGRNNAAFAKLGISTRTARGEIKTAGQILPELADGLQRIQSPAQRSALLVELFGRSGQKLGPLLEGGAAGLKRFTDEAERTGQVLSDKAIADADKAADNIAKLQNQLRVSIAAAVSENATAIAHLAEAVTKLTVSAVRFAATDLERVKEVGGALAGAYAGGRLAGAPGAVIGAAAGGVGAAGGQRQGSSLIYREAGGGLRGALAVLGSSRETLLERARREATTQALLSNFSLDGPGRSGGGAALAGLFGEGGGGGGRVKAAATKAAAEVSDAMKRLEQSASGPGILNGAFKPLDETAERLREIQTIAINIPEIKPINLEALQLAEDFSTRLVEGLGQAIIFGQSWGEAMLNSIRAVAAQLFTSGLLDLLKGGKGGGGGILGSIATGIGALFKPAGARANGGPVSAGRAYLVGERGPELLFPGMSGTIASNRQAFGMGRQQVDVHVTAAPELMVAAVVGGRVGGSQTAAAMMESARRPQLARGAGAA